MQNNSETEKRQDEVSERGKAIYESRFMAQCEPEHNNQGNYSGPSMLTTQ